MTLLLLPRQAQRLPQGQLAACHLVVLLLLLLHVPEPGMNLAATPLALMMKRMLKQRQQG